MAGVAASAFVESKIIQRPVVLFGKSYCPDSKRVKSLLKDEYHLDEKTLEVVNIEKRQDVNQIEDYFMICCLSDRREMPQLWISGKYVGNEFNINHLHKDGKLGKMLSSAGLSVPAVSSEMADVPEPSAADKDIKVLQQMGIIS